MPCIFWGKFCTFPSATAAYIIRCIYLLNSSRSTKSTKRSMTISTTSCCFSCFCCCCCCCVCWCCCKGSRLSMELPHTILKRFTRLLINQNVQIVHVLSWRYHEDGWGHPFQLQADTVKYTVLYPSSATSLKSKWISIIHMDVDFNFLHINKFPFWSTAADWLIVRTNWFWKFSVSRLA